MLNGNLLLAIVTTLLVPTLALENGLGRTPPMGWNSRNLYGCVIDENLIKRTADAMVDKGFLAAGYNRLNIDDCWQAEYRDEFGMIGAHPRTFSSGIRSLADYIHGNGKPGSLGYEEQDAASYTAWQVDYVKVGTYLGNMFPRYNSYDNCNYPLGTHAEPRFRKMYQALNETGRNFYYSLSEWGTGRKSYSGHLIIPNYNYTYCKSDQKFVGFNISYLENPWEWAADIANSWRISLDIEPSWQSLIDIASVAALVTQFSHPGAWNDLDILEVGNPGLSLEESRTHFSLWAALKAPLLMGNDLTNTTQEVFDILTNLEIIAVNVHMYLFVISYIIRFLPVLLIQLGLSRCCMSAMPVQQDPLGISASRVIQVVGEYDIWAGPLVHGSYVAVLINYRDTPQKITLRFQSIGYSGDIVTVRDLWRRVNVGRFLGRYTTIVPPHGAAVLKLTNGHEQFHPKIPVHRPRVEPNRPIIYEAEHLNNTVLFNANRHGCYASCSGGAKVIRIGIYHVNNEYRYGEFVLTTANGGPEGGTFEMLIEWTDLGIGMESVGVRLYWRANIAVNDGVPLVVPVPRLEHRGARWNTTVVIVLKPGKANQIRFWDDEVSEMACSGSDPNASNDFVLASTLAPSIDRIIVTQLNEYTASENGNRTIFWPSSVAHPKFVDQSTYHFDG
ncbi:glycoside hydrolase superfamily [Jimgerdemannia flammicorona]|uniref:Alpha-galactosidase n=1 Tax=Jimgerdemannia flammicorona TaxID=994334 RepID=A0A433D622_9FUNG|nr:glycoside hydrolase superfamily [Jimgerdemannia flammicorona]